MALTTEQRLAQEIGGLVVRIYQLEAALEAAQEKIKELEASRGSVTTSEAL